MNPTRHATRGAGGLARTDDRGSIAEHFREVRRTTRRLAEPLSAEDAAVQSMPCCSPAKWHLAHSTWFFETLVLDVYAAGWETYDPAFRVLFNSYYNSIGEQFPRPKRGLLTRPTHKEVLAYRAAIDEAILILLDKASGRDADEIAEIVVLGLHHEQQHQELMLSDVKHLFSCNPLSPVYASERDREASESTAQGWIEIEGGIREVGHAGEGFAYDNESPRHEALVHPFRLADRLVTNGEWLAFIEDRGYQRAELWLDPGFSFVQRENVAAPLHWRNRRGEWTEFTLNGERPLRHDEPVAHVSFFEAEAFARWAGARLPTEFEWEAAAVEHTDGVRGNLLETDELHPRPAAGSGLRQMYGDVWEWTRSDYAPYPGYRPPEGAVGEYNGKFMSGQYVLRGGCCATAAWHLRQTYRNFYGPESRWCFAGVRLAGDI